ncbi:MAG: DUF2877 domain-containing protein [Arachnia sp.]
MSSPTYTTALGGDRDVLASLVPGMRGRVHSAFRSVINVATGHPELISVTGACVARAPRAVQVCLDRLDDHGISVGDVVFSDGHTLRIGESFIVVVSGTPAWQEPRPGGVPLAGRLSMLDGLLAAQTPVRNVSAFEVAVAERVQRGVEDMTTAVLAQNAADVDSAAASLVGLGVGLTPTGDDVLTGAAFVASRLGGPLTLVHDAVAGVVGSGVTNDISLTAMRCALRGRAVQPIEDLYAWLCGAGTHNPHDLVADVLAIGHTSGADLALGLLTAVRLHHESQEQ